MTDFYEGPKKINFDGKALDGLLHSTTGDVGKHMLKIGLEIQAGAKAMAPHRTGNLARSIYMKHSRLVESQKVVVGSNLRYAYNQHEGEGPHVIVPRHSRVLYFTSRGRGVWTTVVHSPGYRGRHYLTIPMARAVRR